MERDIGDEYADRNCCSRRFVLCGEGFPSRAEGPWDDLTVWTFEKR